MLPAKTSMTTKDTGTDIEVTPGSWWRLSDPTHALASRAAPDHGLVLMVEEARMVDGDLHTVVLYPHPLWTHTGSRASCKLLADDFLQAFRPEPDGAAIRETEIAGIMGRVEDLTREIASPPEPMSLIERQTDKSQGTDRPETQSAPKTEDPSKPQDAPDSTGAETQDAFFNPSLVPAALLPSKDVVAAQKAIETRIAAIEAQKAWIEARTDEMSSSMSLVGIYQKEKVAGAMASISQESRRAETLLENVHTMRLFLGEGMAVTCLRDGAGADPSEPLTFMQRMLYLDEEIFVSEALDGFNADMMRDLPQLLEENFTLVERMLPCPRSVVITRVRRKDRQMTLLEKMSISDFLEAIAIAKADQRIQILVRDGERVHMITADEVTSNAQRLFPSKAEIDALFTKRGMGNSREITPTDIDYTDARAQHDTRGLFYKRFLIILWGVHERSNVFGDFTPRGANWLDATIHSDRFRFIHDEENALTDGLMPIETFMEKSRHKARAGSRVIVDWEKAANDETAPAFCDSDPRTCRIHFKGELVAPMGLAMLKPDGGRLVARMPVYRGRNSWDRENRRQSTTPVALARPRSADHTRHRPEMMHDPRLADGWLCIDDLDVATIDRYLASREARASHHDWIHHFVMARDLLAREEADTAHLAERLGADTDTNSASNTGADRTPQESAGTNGSAGDVFRHALQFWRRTRKWAWPDTDGKTAQVMKIAARMGEISAIRALAETHGSSDWLRAGLKPNGDIFVITDTPKQCLADNTPLPWMTQTLYRAPRAGRPCSETLVSWFDLDKADYLTLLRNEAAENRALDRLAPQVERTQKTPLSGSKTLTIRPWLTPLAWCDPAARDAMTRIEENGALARAIIDLMEGNRQDMLLSWLDTAYTNRRVERDRRVQIPRAGFDLGFLSGTSANGLPTAWKAQLWIDLPHLAWALGLQTRVRAHVQAIYQSPEKVIERISNTAHTWSNPTVMRLSRAPVAQDLCVEDICLSVDHASAGLFKAHAGNDRLTWREGIAWLATDPEVKNWMPVYTADKLRDAAQRIHVIGSIDSMRLMEVLYRKFEGEKT